MRREGGREGGRRRRERSEGKSKNEGKEGKEKAELSREIDGKDLEGGRRRTRERKKTEATGR